MVRLQEYRSKKSLRSYVYVSKLDRNLLPTLADFFSSGIERGDLCIAILSPRHKRFINKLLQDKGIDVKTATKRGQYLALNAKNILSVIDFGEQFDEATYQRAIENASALVAGEKTVRVFGEIVVPAVPYFTV